MSGIAGKYLNLAARRRQFSSAAAAALSLSAAALRPAIMIFFLSTAHTRTRTFLGAIKTANKESPESLVGGNLFRNKGRLSRRLVLFWY
jgi:hypothetical protein